VEPLAKNTFVLTIVHAHTSLGQPRENGIVWLLEEDVDVDEDREDRLLASALMRDHDGVERTVVANVPCAVVRLALCLG